MFSSDTHIDLYRLEGAGQDASLTKTQLLAAMAVSTGSMIVGYSSAWSSPAIASLMEPGSHIEVSMECCIVCSQKAFVDRILVINLKVISGFGLQSIH